jgi:hypothetical protein
MAGVYQKIGRDARSRIHLAQIFCETPGRTAMQAVWKTVL